MEIAAVIFVLIMLAVAYIAFRILKKTVKMAMRALIVLLILVVAAAGGIALWNMNSGAPVKTTRTKKSR
ncbi:MAG: hypothetical protein KDB79_06395 [Acidobacteria bacterium]|nr:hypothetical protein [Acidobacteriota bacterium]